MIAMMVCGFLVHQGKAHEDLMDGAMIFGLLEILIFDVWIALAILS